MLSLDSGLMLVGNSHNHLGPGREVGAALGDET